MLRSKWLLSAVLASSVWLLPSAASAQTKAVAEAVEQAPKAQAPEVPAVDDDVPVGGFVDLEWRVLGLAEHVSHGPAFAAGVTFLNGLLRLGIGALGRPGPINPATFDVRVPDGKTYKGKRDLELKSDGAMVGVHLGLSLPLPFYEPLSIQVPLTVGYGGFGFYLHGEDRETPDGRRVSEWENELFDGKDSFLGVVIDTGLRLGYQPEDVPWLRPYAGVSFTVVPNYETFVRNDYLGFGGVVGLEIGHGI
jgi:hypothetical protein